MVPPSLPNPWPMSVRGNVNYGLGGDTLCTEGVYVGCRSLLLPKNRNHGLQNAPIG